VISQNPPNPTMHRQFHPQISPAVQPIKKYKSL
jgi:hypothetical protein